MEDIASSKHIGKCDYHRNWEINVEKFAENDS
jgi:hypothetical protein